jgi:hypothetical protein
LSRPTWRPSVVGERIGWSPSRYASIRTLGEPTLFGDPVHRMRSVLSRTYWVLQSSERSLLFGDGPSSQLRSHLLLRSEARSGERSRALRTTLGSSRPCWGHHLLFSFFFPAPSPLSKRPPVESAGARCGADRRLLRSPTTDAVAPRASWPRPPPLVSLSSCLPERPSSPRGA